MIPWPRTWPSTALIFKVALHPALHLAMRILRLPTRRGTRLLGTFLHYPQQKIRHLHFISSIYTAPDSSKGLHSKGEDAWLMRDSVVGVADGVGGWASEGIDSGEYSRALMKCFSKEYIKSNESHVDSQQLLSKAHNQVKLKGSCTASIVSIQGSFVRKN